MYQPPKKTKKLSSDSIKGYRAQLVAAINRDRTGAIVGLDLTTANVLVQICDELAHVHKNHEQPAEVF